MKREEAIRIIETVFQDEYVYKYYDSITHQALEVAIEALSAEAVQGEWIDQDNGAFYPYECSNCHEPPICDDYGYYLTNYCPNCGARMKGGEGE